MRSGNRSLHNVALWCLYWKASLLPFACGAFGSSWRWHRDLSSGRCVNDFIRMKCGQRDLFSRHQNRKGLPQSYPQEFLDASHVTTENVAYGFLCCVDSVFSDIYFYPSLWKRTRHVGVACYFRFRSAPPSWRRQSGKHQSVIIQILLVQLHLCLLFACIFLM